MKYVEYVPPHKLAEEARKAREENPETPKEHFERLAKAGFINEKGELTTLLGGPAEPENNPEIKGDKNATGKES